MKFIFKSTLKFSVLYLLLYLLDSFFKNSEDLVMYRYLSKTLLSFSLLFFYLINTNQSDARKKNLIIISLACFLAGDVFFIAGNSGNTYHFLIAAALFIIAKVCYSVRFFNNKDFKISKLVPFLLFCFCYMSVIMSIVYNELGFYFLPLLIYLFVVMMLMQFAYLRSNEVNLQSFWLVIFGVVASMVADSINILRMFYDADIAYNKITIMFFYCLSQYLIILGVLNETKSTSKLKPINV
ncbi:lysoplasmalogenase family protein [Olleya namhaensis]|uniref:lysoplasmalogenase family protein n=1 Tax=Olleya namhaensis TaxID=1144750 RepID=UPI00232F2B2A|nr:lysoplasmalogenase family protein [Olleya namhaensis]